MSKYVINKATLFLGQHKYHFEFACEQMYGDKSFYKKAFELEGMNLSNDN